MELRTKKTNSFINNTNDEKQERNEVFLTGKTAREYQQSLNANGRGFAKVDRTLTTVYGYLDEFNGAHALLYTRLLWQLSGDPTNRFATGIVPFHIACELGIQSGSNFETRIAKALNVLQKYDLIEMRNEGGEKIEKLETYYAAIRIYVKRPVHDPAEFVVKHREHIDQPKAKALLERKHFEYVRSIRARGGA